MKLDYFIQRCQIFGLIFDWEYVMKCESTDSNWGWHDASPLFNKGDFLLGFMTSRESAFVVEFDAFVLRTEKTSLTKSHVIMNGHFTFSIVSTHFLCWDKKKNYVSKTKDRMGSIGSLAFIIRGSFSVRFGISFKTITHPLERLLKWKTLLHVPISVIFSFNFFFFIK